MEPTMTVLMSVALCVGAMILRVREYQQATEGATATVPTSRTFGRRSSTRERWALRARGIRLERIAQPRIGWGVPDRELEVNYGGRTLGRIAQARTVDGKPDGPWTIAEGGAFHGLPISGILGAFPTRSEAAEAVVQAHYAAHLVPEPARLPNGRPDTREFVETVHTLIGHGRKAARPA